MVKKLTAIGTPEPTEEKGDRTEKRQYINEAAIRLQNLLFDTTEEHLLGLTRINSSREALLLSIQITKEAALDPERIANTESPLFGTPLTRIWRRSFLMLRRSIDMKAFMLGVGLAHEQVAAEVEEASEEAEI